MMKLALLLALACQVATSPQTPAQPVRPVDPLNIGPIESDSSLNAFLQALRDSKLVYTGDEVRVERKLEVPEASDAKASPDVWSGSKVEVEQQLGTLTDGRPLFATLVVPANAVSSVAGRTDAALRQLKHFVVGGGVDIQSCTTPGECVKTCVDRDGKKYCCKRPCK